MSTIIKLVLALLLLNAAAQAGLAAYNYYQFEDAVHEAVLFANNASDQEIVDKIMTIADEEDIPLEAANVQVTHNSFGTNVAMSYTRDVTLVPGIYTKTWTFTPTASIRTLGPPLQRKR